MIKARIIPYAAAGAFLLALLVAAVDYGPQPAASASPPLAYFTWTRPEHYASISGQPPLPAYMKSQVTDLFTRVLFNACLPGQDSTTKFKWEVEGKTIETTRCDGFDYSFANYGTYDVKLTVSDLAGESAPVTKKVVVRDFLIVSVGDSVASGEGNPENPSADQADNQWSGAPAPDGERCHRSWMAGPSLAALELERIDAHSSVTFVHVACSGAGIIGEDDQDVANGGLLSPYEGQEDASPPLPPQLKQVKELVGDRPIDALLINIGANDIGFGQIVLNCLVHPACHLPIVGNAYNLWNSLKDKLRAKYDRLNDRLFNPLLANGSTNDLYLGDNLQQDHQRVYITGYYDPTRNDQGEVCDPLVEGLITKAEAEWASTSVVAGLNERVRAAAIRNNWRYVGGEAPAFIGPPGHGYCASDHWVNQILESFHQQGDQDGSFHPNLSGQKVYRDELVYHLRWGLGLLDVTPPSSKKQGLTAGGTYENSVTPTITVEDPSGIVTDSFSMTLDGRPYISGTPITGRGQHTLVITALDTAGNELIETISFTVYWTTALSVPDGTAQITDPLTLQATLRDAHGDPIDGAALAFDASPACSGTATTAASGVSTLACGAVTASEGTYSLNVSFAQDDVRFYRASSGTATITVEREGTIVTLANAAAQYSDSIGLSATLTDDDATPTPLASKPLSFSVAGACSGSATTDGSGMATFVCSGVPLPAGTYPISASYAGDATYKPSSSGAQLSVSPEDATVAYDATNPMAVKVAAPGGSSGTFALRLIVSETQPDVAGGLPGGPLALPGDISKAQLTATLQPIGPGSPVSGNCTNGVASGTGYSAILPVTCVFQAVPVNVYSVLLNVVGGFYQGGTEDVITIYDSSLGFVTGGGAFAWPGTGDRTTFGFTVKYNKGTNPQGSLVLIRHLPDGTIYRLKSNALAGMAVGDGGGFGWATITGKATYQEPTWPEALGNYRFVVYIEDRNEPGSGVDRFWVQVNDKNRVLVSALSITSPATSNAVQLTGGNIAVPHNPG